MQLYTINATPIKDTNAADNNHLLLMGYPIYVAKLLSTFNIDGFTIYPVTGYWQGKKEQSFKIELALKNDNDIRVICGWLRDTYKQDAVMLTLPDNSVEFI